VRAPQLHGHLHRALAHFLFYLHPFMPFLTSHIWNHTPHLRLVYESTPLTNETTATTNNKMAAVNAMEAMIGLISVIRSAGRVSWVKVQCTDPLLNNVLDTHASTIRTLTRITDLTFSESTTTDARVLPVPNTIGLCVYVPVTVATPSKVTVERVQEKLRRLDERWARTDQTRVPASAVEAHHKARAVLLAQLLDNNNDK
jgi:valyl-tRNA synthetase